MNQTKNLREVILDQISERAPIKAVDLVIDVMNIIHPINIDSDEYHKIIEEFTKSGEIIELEYTDPGMPYRVKSMFFRKGTKLILEGEIEKQWQQARLDRDSTINTKIPH